MGGVDSYFRITEMLHLSLPLSLQSPPGYEFQCFSFCMVRDKTTRAYP